MQYNNNNYYHKLLYPPPDHVCPGYAGELHGGTYSHPSGTLRVGAQATQVKGEWTVTKAIMSRSARVLMEGWVRVPGGLL